MNRDGELTSADLRLFVTLAGAPTLAAAARVLDVSRSAVTQRLAQLETRLHCRLLERSKRRLRPTSEGELLLARARAGLNDLDDLAGLLNARRGVVSGHLRVSAPLGRGLRDARGDPVGVSGIAGRGPRAPARRRPVPVGRARAHEPRRQRRCDRRHCAVGRCARSRVHGPDAP